MRTYKFRNSGQTYTGVPIMAANMDTVGTFETARTLNKVSASIMTPISICFDFVLFCDAGSTSCSRASTNTTHWNSGLLSVRKTVAFLM